MLDEVAGRELGAVLQAPIANWTEAPSVVRRVKPWTSVRLVAWTPTITPTICWASGGGLASGRPVPPSRTAAAPVSTTIATMAMTNRFLVRGSTAGPREPQPARLALPRAPVPVLPGAWIGVPSAQRGQVSGPGS